MNYKEKFNKYSTVELLRIIDNSDDYQPQAVETARDLLANRQLSEEEIKIAKEEIEASTKDSLRKEKKKKQLEEDFKKIWESIVENINPIQNKPLTGEKTIKIIAIIFSGLFLIQLYKEFGMLCFIFSNSAAVWDLSMVFYFIPLIALPTAIILFYKRKKTGWFIMAIFAIYSAISKVFLFIITLKLELSDFHSFDNIFVQISPAFHVFGFLFFVASVWTISKENVRNIFAVTKLTMILTVSVTTLIVGFGLNFIS